MWNLIITIISLFILGVLYDKYKVKESKNDFKINNDLIRKYLIGEENYNNLNYSLNNGKPNLWIYIDYEKNSRKWLSFGSRTSYRLNKPYILSTIETIIRNSADDFNICLIDEKSFELLIPGWSIELNKLSEPLKGYITNLGLMKLLYYYGGMIVPRTFISFKPLFSLYDFNINNENDSFICYTQDNTITSTYNKFTPNINFMGALKESNVIKNIIQKMEILTSNDYTNERQFKGTIEQYINYLVERNQILCIEPEYIGCAKYNNYNEKDEILLEDLFSNIPIKLNENTYGIYLPEREISLRTKYNWFDYISFEEIVNSDYNIANYMRIGLYH